MLDAVEMPQGKAMEGFRAAFDAGGFKLSN
jgi:hypothetical protein